MAGEVRGGEPGEGKGEGEGEKGKWTDCGGEGWWRGGKGEREKELEQERGR